MSTQTRKETYDVVIVGSGAAGGITAKVLVEKGLKVAMLEAGALRDQWADFPYHEQFPYEDPYRLFNQKQSPQAEMKAKFSFIKNPDEPYTTPEELPYEWFRTRNVGGRTLFWGRFINRFNEIDLKGYSHDGRGKDWPLAYTDLAPYYDKVETFIGVCGTKENHPDLPDSDTLLPPVNLKCPDHLIKRACAKIGIRAIPARRAMLTRALGGFKACHYCAACDNGCETHSFFNSAFRIVVPFLEKYPRNFKLITNAMARSINVNDKGLASGVTYIDKTTGKTEEINARAVVAACGTLETTRLMLLSTSTRFPQGIANSSGQVGRNFMEHLDAKAQAFLPELSFSNFYEGDGIGGSHIIVPWFGYDRPKNAFNFVRGFHLEPSARLGMRPDKSPKSFDGFGANFKREVRRWYGTRVRLSSHGEMLASPQKYVELDKTVVDKWGMPVLKIYHPWDDNDRAMFKGMQDTFTEILTAAKAVEISVSKNPETPGASIHEMGTAHMGDDPKTSVLNKFNQAWDVKNLFVTDGAAFTSGSHKNPTHHIMALAWRASEYMAEEMRKGNL
ncbi:MAG TPA: GMC family oxidoreductase [Pyrinomonadaceae bacterium]|nr:GMC family oxidoreductase [Pyrinomonadaceae bacterium]